MIFDLFSLNKQTDNKSTNFGLILSILTIFLFFYLFFNEYIKYKQPVLKKNTMVYNHEKYNYINVVIDIDLVKAPCSMLSFGIKDELIHNKMDVEGITKIRIDKEGKEIGEFKDQKQPKKDAEDDIKNSIGCKLKGTFKIYKIKGFFHISFHKYSNIYLELLNDVSDLLEKMDLGYKINELEFKSIKENVNISNNLKKKFNLKNEFDFILDKNIHEFKNISAVHFLDIIPVVMESEITKNKATSFINSFHRNFITVDDGQLPILQFRYKFSAVSVHYIEYKNRKIHFLVEVLGIFGGIYFIMHLIKSFYFRLKKDQINIVNNKFI